MGQYAFQVTPLQLARGIAVIANGGYLLEPHLENGGVAERVKISLSDKTLQVVQQGMRQAVTGGTARALNQYSIAAKTGTSQIGGDGTVNSLLIGFFPYEKPQYAFAIVMEESDTESGAIAAAKLFFERLALYAPEYLETP